MKRENQLMVIETQHNVKTIQSEICKDLYYIFDDDRKGLGFMQFFGEEMVVTALSRAAIRAIRDEIKDIYDVIFN